MSTKYTIKGIVSAERPCECCGNKNLERNVILCDESQNLMYVGATCAAYLLHGTKNRKQVKLVENEARARAYADKWTEVYGTSASVLERIADRIRVHYCPAYVSNNTLVIG